MIKICVWTRDMTPKVTLARWTQSSGPLCLWQCFCPPGDTECNMLHLNGIKSEHTCSRTEPWAVGWKAGKGATRSSLEAVKGRAGARHRHGQRHHHQSRRQRSPGQAVGQGWRASTLFSNIFSIHHQFIDIFFVLFQQTLHSRCSQSCLKNVKPQFS